MVEVYLRKLDCSVMHECWWSFGLRLFGGQHNGEAQVCLEDWARYQNEQFYEAYERFRPFVSNCFWLCVIPGTHLLRVGLAYLQGRDDGLSLQSVATISIAFFIGHSFNVKHENVKAFIDRAPYAAGIFTETCFYGALMILFTIAALQVPGDLQKHRLFLTSVIPLQVLNIYVGYFPWTFLIFVIGPLFLTVWIFFHYHVGFLNLQVVSFGLVFFVCLVRVFVLMERHRWEVFQLKQALDAKTHELNVTEQALRSMHRSIFDASGVCTPEGTLTSWSPQLQLMLGLTTKRPNLCNFASTPEEQVRLRNFLKAAEQLSIYQAAIIESTLVTEECTCVKDQENCCSSLASTEYPSATRSITLHCVCLPGSTNSGDTQEKLLMLGLRDVTPAGAGLVEARPNDTQPTLNFHPRSYVPHGSRQSRSRSSQSSKSRLSVIQEQVPVRELYPPWAQSMKPEKLGFHLLRLISCLPASTESCCFFHSGLETTLHKCHALGRQRCIHHWKPNEGWQCKNCFGLNMEDEGAEDVCPLCLEPTSS
eukprot:TRINITY_DN9826_c0_g1_i1.p1 TRINITY_DN9826_c0_g1~~TRINITY_DN9826_c0_g1_i1.p1  ORF type:complete len:549 (+),score=47.24 TRINITY_DN9826_c0_g1_i1:45-1649(+)